MSDRRFIGWVLGGFMLCFMSGTSLHAQQVDEVKTIKGSSTLKQTETVSKVRFDNNARVRLNNHQLIINESIEGDQYVIYASGRNSGIRTRGDMSFHGTLRGGAFRTMVNIFVDKGTLTYQGRFEAADSGGDKGIWKIARGARLYFGKQAHINQQFPDKIMARVIRAEGEGVESVLEFDPEFNADHMGWPDLAKFKADGFSVLYVKDTRLVTHATQSLPSVHKLSGNGNHTHHGVLVFEGDQARWDVQTEQQEYDGVFAFNGRFVLNTEKDLLFTGHFFEDSHCYFGSWGSKTGTPEMIKTGQAKLVLLGTQLYGSTTIIRVREGTVVFGTATANPGHYVLTRYKDKGGDWANLKLIVEKEGHAQLMPPGRLPSKLQSIEQAGNLMVGDSLVSVREDAVFKPGSVTGFRVGAGNMLNSKHGTRPVLRVGGELKLGGEIRLRVNARGKGPMLLVEAGKISGKADWYIPRGYVLEISEKQILLTPAK